jgi:hypothetical protein
VEGLPYQFAQKFFARGIARTALQPRDSFPRDGIDARAERRKRTLDGFLHKRGRDQLATGLGVLHRHLVGLLTSQPGPLGGDIGRLLSIAAD